MTRPSRSAAGALEIPEAGSGFDWLFLDLNSYFASVEQQTRPELRGRPVAVVPVETDFTCAIAASYEAKALGIKTGTMIHEAKRRCPDIVCVLADHRKYVDYHHRILAEIDRHVPVEHIMSIDEVACRLYRDWRAREPAVALAGRIKRGIAENVGICLTSSIGISTNRFLAKVASDLQKPDGLVVLHPAELPERIRHLQPNDLPGIGRNLQKRLWRARVDTVQQLWNCPPKQLRAIWRSVEGERFWYQLRGIELPESPTKHNMISHSHVLGPEHRPAPLAGVVARRLLLKAADRLRREELRATRLSLSVRLEKGPRLETGAAFPPASDSLTLLGHLVRLWENLVAETGNVLFKKIGVALHELRAPDELRQLDLFSTANAAGDDRSSQARRDRLSVAMERINDRFGRDSITLGVMPGSVKQFTGAKIAFNRVPGARDFPRERSERP